MGMIDHCFARQTEKYRGIFVKEKMKICHEKVNEEMQYSMNKDKIFQ